MLELGPPRVPKNCTFLPFKWFKKNVKGMCQCSLTFFKEVCHFFPLYPLVVHVLRYCKVKILLNFVSFFGCVVSVGGILFVWCWLVRHPTSLLQSTLISWQCFVSIFSKFVKYALNLEEVHISITYTHFKIAKKYVRFGYLTNEWFYKINIEKINS